MNSDEFKWIEIKLNVALIHGLNLIHGLYFLLGLYYLPW